MVFVIVHAAASFGAATPVMMASILLKGSCGVVVGVLWARYGFEHAMLCHAVGHALAVTVTLS